MSNTAKKKRGLGRSVPHQSTTRRMPIASMDPATLRGLAAEFKREAYQQRAEDERNTEAAKRFGGVPEGGIESWGSWRVFLERMSSRMSNRARTAQKHHDTMENQ